MFATPAIPVDSGHEIVRSIEYGQNSSEPVRSWPHESLVDLAIQTTRLHPRRLVNRCRREATRGWDSGINRIGLVAIRFSELIGGVYRPQFGAVVPQLSRPCLRVFPKRIYNASVCGINVNGSGYDVAFRTVFVEGNRVVPTRDPARDLLPIENNSDPSHFTAETTLRAFRSDLGGYGTLGTANALIRVSPEDIFSGQGYDCGV